MPGPKKKDLVVLVADKNMHSTVAGLLSRRESLGIRNISFDVYRHPARDAGCFRGCDRFLQPLSGQFKKGLVMFDRHGSGCRDEASRTDLEAEVESRLARSWAGRASAVVFDPELEIWVWSDSPHVDDILGWTGKQPDLRTWLLGKGFLQTGHSKPDNPKEAMEEALRHVKKARSSSLYDRLSRVVSLDRCNDPAFLKFRSVVGNWFPQEGL